MSNIVRALQAAMGRGPDLDLSPPTPMPPTGYVSPGQQDPSMQAPAMTEPQMSPEYLEEFKPPRQMFADEYAVPKGADHQLAKQNDSDYAQHMIQQRALAQQSMRRKR